MTSFQRTWGAARRSLVVACAITILAAPAAMAETDDAQMAKDAGMGLGSAMASLVYAPVKTFYAIGGVVVSGLAFAFSGGDAEVARVVLEPSVLGDYVITTDHLTGDRAIEFFGEQAEVQYEERYREAEPEVAAAPDGW